jgi:hypothetical protein
VMKSVAEFLKIRALCQSWCVLVVES